MCTIAEVASVPAYVQIIGALVVLAVAASIGLFILIRRPCPVPAWAWMLWTVSATSGLLMLLTAVWHEAPGVVAPNQQNDRNGIGLVCILGALGGFARWMHLYRSRQAGQDTKGERPSEKVSPQSPQIEWGLWPLQGSVMALFVVLLFRAGVSSNSGSTVDHTNWFFLYAVACMAGMFAPEAVRHLQRVFETLFGGDPSNRDSSQKGRDDQGDRSNE